MFLVPEGSVMMTLRDGIRFVRELRKELVLFNVRSDDPIDEQLRSLFATQNVDIATQRTSSGDPTLAVLSGRKGVDVIDVSTLRALVGGTPGGTNGIGIDDAEFETVLTRVKETTFTSCDSERLLYASREIEDRARRVGSGVIHTGFQRVSVIHDQRPIYADLASRNVTVHTYGIPDTPVPDLGSGRTHAVDADEIAETWFVVFDGGDDPGQRCALVAEERAPEEFYGVWTYDATLVGHLREYLERTYVNGRNEPDGAGAC